MVDVRRLVADAADARRLVAVDGARYSVGDKVTCAARERPITDPHHSLHRSGSNLKV
jgi:hypothetical protein